MKKTVNVGLCKLWFWPVHHPLTPHQPCLAVENVSVLNKNINLLSWISFGEANIINTRSADVLIRNVLWHQRPLLKCFLIILINRNTRHNYSLIGIGLKWQTEWQFSLIINLVMHHLNQTELTWSSCKLNKSNSACLFVSSPLGFMKSSAGNSSDAPRTRREQSKPFKQSAAGRDGMLFWDNGTVAVVMQQSKKKNKKINAAVL